MADSTASPFAPSELVLLNGDRFAKKAWIGNVALLHMEAQVAANELGQAILVAAFLAADQAGDMRLEVQQKKALLGLARRETLGLALASAPAAWPAHSLEQRLRATAERLARGGKPEVSDVVYALLGQDSAGPWQVLIEMSKEGLAARGLLEKVSVKKLKVFTMTHYVLPEAVATELGRYPAEPIRALLAQCQSQRPAIWKLLVAHCKRAISQRTESSMDTDDD